MIGLGTIINVIAIIAGGIIGLFLKKEVSKKMQEGMLTSLGLCTVFIGMIGVIEQVNNITNVTMMMVISLIIGTMLGTWIDFDAIFIRLGEKLKVVTNSKKDKDFLKGFLTTSFTVAIGAMAIIGSIKDGMQHDYSILFAKSILDFTITLMMTTTMGKGCIFACIPVFILQGIMTLIAFFVGPFLITTAINNLSLVGSMIICCVGINLMFDKKIKIANMLPSLLVALLWAYIFK